MSEKTYKSRYEQHSLTLILDDGKRRAINFKDGEYTTSDPDVQGHIESVHAFGTVITVKSPEEVKKDNEAKAAHVASLKDVRDAADKKFRDQQAKAKAEQKAAEATKAHNDKLEAERRAEHDRHVSGVVAREKRAKKLKEAVEKAEKEAAEAEAAKT